MVVFYILLAKLATDEKMLVAAGWDGDHDCIEEETDSKLETMVSTKYNPQQSQFSHDEHHYPKKQQANTPQEIQTEEKKQMDLVSRQPRNLNEKEENSVIFSLNVRHVHSKNQN